MTYTNLFVCEVEYYDDEDNKERTEKILCNAKDYAECTHELKWMYGDTINSMKMTALEEGPIVISDEIAEAFIHADPFFAVGVKE